MVYCLQLTAGFSTAARRDNIRSEIETRIAGRARWQLDAIESREVRVPAPVTGDKVAYPHGLYVELRFVASLDADDLEQRVKDRATGVRAPLDGSWIRVHNCPHDEGQACGSGRRGVWVGGVLVAG